MKRLPIFSLFLFLIIPSNVVKASFNPNYRISAADNLNPGPQKDWIDLNLQKNNKGYYSIKDNPFLAIKFKDYWTSLDGFFGIKKQKDIMVWVADQTITGSHVRKVVSHLKNYNQSIHINTGRHGNSNGDSLKDYPSKLTEGSFIREDFDFIKNMNNVSIHTVSSYSSAIYPKRADHVIDAWCYSKKELDKTFSQVTCAHTTTHPVISLVFGDGPDGWELRNPVKEIAGILSLGHYTPRMYKCPPSLHRSLLTYL